MNTFEAAQSWVSSGFSVLPIGYRSKRPAFDALRMAGCEVGGRLTWDPFKARAATLPELRLWFTGPRRNLGVVTGWNGLVVLDFDQQDAYQSWRVWARREGHAAARIAESTYQVLSSRGVHVYLIVEEPVDSFAVPGVDVKGSWGYVLAPPSVHPNGHEYRSVGASIACCGRLAEVFPFEKPAPIMEGAPAPVFSDPWEAAGRAVSCGNGSVDGAKQRLRWQDMVQVTHEDRTGMWAHCPLHPDWNPSLRIYPDGRGKCFQCGWHGDVLDLHAALHGQTLRESIASLTNGG